MSDKKHCAELAKLLTKLITGTAALVKETASVGRRACSHIAQILNVEKASWQHYDII